MAKSFYLSNPAVTVNSVDLRDQCTAAELLVRFPPLTATTFGDTAQQYTKGLGDHQLTLTLAMSYETSETYATLKDLVGATTTVRVQPSTGADSSTNPGFILTGTYLAELPVMNATVGELSFIDVTFTGGDYTVDVTP